MTLEKGARLGPYEIQSAIGAGGMGEVYLAHDTRLNRRVAIKVLPPQWASNPDMKMRFDREAQIIAGLNHPNICILHDIGRENDSDYLVMEYIEGETLADRISRSPLPVDDAVRIATEIADALDRAHREGVTHRDLKPGNVMLTKAGAKLLDFGLAKQDTIVKSSADSNSMMPTRVEVTMEGALVGTLQYMAPERLEGKGVTPQTDVFALGAVLYEMLTGKKAFQSDSQAGLISAIMTAAPPSISATQRVDLPGLEFAVKKCLSKDPAERWQSARDLKDHLRWGLQAVAPVENIAAAHTRKRTILIAAIAAGVAVLAVAITAAVLRPQAPVAEEIRFVLDSEVAGSNYAVSPNGRWIAYAARDAGSPTRVLFLRAMNSTTPQKIAGTEDALGPFWSADNKRVGFFAGTSMKAVSIEGGAPETICEAPGTNRSAAWNSEGTIVFSSNNVLNRVSASGGKPDTLTSLNEGRAETLHVLPSFLPDGQHYLYTVTSQQLADRAVYAGMLGSKDATRILSLRTQAVYSAGNILYVEESNLISRPFDVGKLSFTGEPVRIASNVDASFSASSNGVLVYREAAPPIVFKYQFSWMDRTGKPGTTVARPERYLPYWDLSADGKQAAVSQIDSQTSNLDIAVLDLDRGLSSRVTTDPSAEANPHWAPDGLRVAYTTQKKGNRDIFAKNASGLGIEEELVNSPEAETLDDWSRDGKYILYRTGANTNTIYALPLFGDRKRIAVVDSASTKGGSQLSPDGRWLAYNDLESGSWQVFVVSFPKANQKRQISTNGGIQPHWRGDSKELYFMGPDGIMMAADIVSEPNLTSGSPHSLFDTGMKNPSADGKHYDVTGDGKRFLMLKDIPPDTTIPPMPKPVSVIVNWTEALKEKKP